MKKRPKGKPIIFSGDMVRAILNGTKAQTRRVIKIGQTVYRANGQVACPYGQVGDRLWVKETFRINKVDYKKPNFPPLVEYRANADSAMRWTSPLFMPRWASRITLEITNIRVERLQEITEEDAMAEGCSPKDTLAYQMRAYPSWNAKLRYAELWDSLNAKRGYGWATNPFCWVIFFRKLDSGET